MMTVMTETTLTEGQEPQWDEAYRRRADAVTDQEGWIGLQLLIPLDAPNKRVVLGTWRSRADWEAWHNSDTFRETREPMDAAEEDEHRHDRWFEVVTRETGSNHSRHRVMRTVNSLLHRSGISRLRRQKQP